jgi:hypothetical protein
MPRKHPPRHPEANAPPYPKRKRARPLSPQDLEWCDPDYDLEVEPEPGDFDLEQNCDDD